MSNWDEENKKRNKLIVVSIIVGFMFIASLFAIGPIYNVWSKELKGKAALKEAEWGKQVSIEQAKADLESADLYRQAEIIRAEGVAEANAIIAGTLEEEYLRYLWINGLHDGTSEVIYIATEAGLPILEAGRLN